MADREVAQQPAADLSYDEIVDMLVHNKPVPGIVEIPDTVLGPESGSESRAPPRPKPWETQSQNDS